MLTTGHIILDRDCIEGDIGKDPTRLWIWTKLLSRANIRPATIVIHGVTHSMEIGELFVCQTSLAAEIRVHRNTIARCVQYLRKSGRIGVRTVRTGIIVSISKYREYYPMLYGDGAHPGAYPGANQRAHSGAYPGRDSGAHNKKKELRTNSLLEGETPVGSEPSQPSLLPNLPPPPGDSPQAQKRVRAGSKLLKVWDPTHPWDAAFKRLSTAYKWADVFDVKQDAGLLDGAMVRYNFTRQQVLELVEELELYLNGEQGAKVKSVRNTFHTFCQVRQKNSFKNGAGAATGNFHRGGWGKGAQASGNLKPGFHARGADEYKGDADYTTDTAYRMLNEAKAKQAADAASNNAVQPQEESVG